MNNIKTAFGKADAATRLAGEAWYFEAQQHAFEIAHATGFSLYQVCGVISALSPLKEWTLNLEIANNFCQHYLAHNDMLMCHFGNNVKKAFDILESDGEPESVEAYFKHGTKTHHFYLNLTGDWSKITWDSHMINLALFGLQRRSISSESYLYLPVKVRASAEKTIHKLCAKHDLQPAQVQAILWLVYRNMEVNND